jgi:enoyl-CoA hydratase/carnithine racemase
VQVLAEYTGGMRSVEWEPGKPAAVQVSIWSKLARKPGILHARFSSDGGDASPAWDELEPWTRSRAVTVAEVRSKISAAALDVALCSDLVYLRRGVELILPSGPPSPGLLWALGRAGRAALARGLLGPGTMAADEAVRLGIAQKVLEIGEDLSISPSSSLVALSTARDLMRSSARARPALELAAFRLLFASGDPRTGAEAFFERKTPDFRDSGSCGGGATDP